MKWKQVPMSTVQEEWRKIAHQAARSELRRLEIDPKIATELEVAQVLDDLARRDKALIASRWYIDASETEWETFTSEWRQWQQRQAELYHSDELGMVTVPDND